MENELIDNGLLLSGINPNYAKTLQVSLSTKQVDSEYFELYRGYVPTFISICPNCNEPYKWRTTGFLPDYFKCKKCNINFRYKL